MLLQIFWRKVLQKCFWNSPLPTICILSKSLILIGCHGNRKAKFSKKYWKIFFSEAIRGIKLKLCINVHDSSLYNNCNFCQKFYRNIPWVVLYKTCLYCCNLLLWLVTMATKRQNWRKKYSNINSSEAVWGIKLKLCRIVSNKSRYKIIVFYCRWPCAFIAMAI